MKNIDEIHWINISDTTPEKETEINVKIVKLTDDFISSNGKRVLRKKGTIGDVLYFDLSEKVVRANFGGKSNFDIPFSLVSIPSEIDTNIDIKLELSSAQIFKSIGVLQQLISKTDNTTEIQLIIDALKKSIEGKEYDIDNELFKRMYGEI